MPEAEHILRWSAPEHDMPERGYDWYVALGVIAVATSITSFLVGDILFGILILVAAPTMGILARSPLREIEFEISSEGIRTHDVLHTYDEILAFWVDEDAHQPLLLLDTVKFLSPNLIIPLAHISPQEVRDTLLALGVEERKMKEPVSHKILEFFGF